MANACEITLEDLISAQYIAKDIKLSTNKKANLLAANNLTRSYGRGMEYSHSRIYQPGDDVRHIDWRLTARHGKTYTKLFHEERGENNTIILDLTSSMYFGTTFALKSVIASKAAAILAWLGFNENNAIGSIVFNNEHTAYTAAKLTQNNLTVFFNNIIQHHQPSSQSNVQSPAQNNLFTAITKFENCLQKHSRIFIISDFYNTNELLYKKIEKLNRHNLVYLIKIADPLETTLLPSGNYNITNGNQSTVLNINKSNQDIIINLFQEKLANYYKIITKLNIKHRELISQEKWYYNLMRL